MKNNIAKISIVVSGCMLFFSVIVFPIIATALGYQFEAVEKVWICLLLTTVVSGIVMVVLIAVFPPKSSKQKITMLKLGYDDFSSFAYDLQKALLKQGFLKQAQESFDNLELLFYMRKYRLWEKDCVAVIKTSQLTDAQLITIEQAITDILGRQSDTINMIAMICVDRVTPAFQKYVRTPAVQGFKNGRFLAGISFGKKNVYLSNHDSIIWFYRYNRLRRLFLSVIADETAQK